MLLSNTLNLLPNEKKNSLERIVRFVFVRDILEIIILAYTLLAIVLVWSWIVLQEDFNSLSESAVSVNKAYSRQNQDIRIINTAVKSVNNASIGYLPLSPKIDEIMNKLPNNIKLSAINIDRKTNSFTLSGTALTRADLIIYQQNLRQIPWLEKTDTPTSQLFQKENINFEVKGKLKSLTTLYTEVMAPTKNTNTNPEGI